MSSHRARQAPGGHTGRVQRGQAGRRPRQPRPLPKGDHLFTPGATSRRQAVEHGSATPLLWLHQMPRWLVPLLAVALLVTGLAARGWIGAAALFGLAAALAWLAAVSWPRLSGQGRALRVVVVGLLVVAGVLRGMHG